MADERSKTINLRESVNLWVARTYELKEALTLTEFLDLMREGKHQEIVEKSSFQPERATERIVSVEVPGNKVEDISSDFDWSVSEFDDREPLYHKVFRQMQRGVCHFSYELVSSGRVRVAYGTLNPKILPSQKQQGNLFFPQTNLNNPQVYWDIEVWDFRSFVPQNLITTVL
ncbi:WYL domain containing protein [uncultured Caudovirales phage]|uniref:WYL domain containing protein n=1 Tax=uncultured Caudovirales phage TaxID=2100421 RepID=A0A6J5QVZ8_9CAUD|nr:WYL domain containing protein [uncultured Caudovirales phage]CAB4193629.1 WYL domain containing protein [uncultured Caudovirales phage]CAB4217539.1 WYL domain containing protein [uncultured Caudovirales phage]CAB5231382.1 WYL domain containing protein [uncultured Caudovirales phage]